MIDAQRQTVPQFGSMSQPSVPSPLTSGRGSSVSGAPRPPTMFSASSNSPDSGGVPVTGYGMPPMPQENNGRGQGSQWTRCIGILRDLFSFVFARKCFALALCDTWKCFVELEVTRQVLLLLYRMGRCARDYDRHFCSGIQVCEKVENMLSFDGFCWCWGWLIVSYHEATIIYFHSWVIKPLFSFVFRLHLNINCIFIRYVNYAVQCFLLLWSTMLSGII